MPVRRSEGERDRRTEMTTEGSYSVGGPRRGSWSACDQSLSDDGKDFLLQIILKFNTRAEGEDGCVLVRGNARLTTCYLV